MCWHRSSPVLVDVLSFVNVCHVYCCLSDLFLYSIRSCLFSIVILLSWYNFGVCGNSSALSYILTYIIKPGFSKEQALHPCSCRPLQADRRSPPHIFGPSSRIHSTTFVGIEHYSTFHFPFDSITTLFRSVTSTRSVTLFRPVTSLHSFTSLDWLMGCLALRVETLLCLLAVLRLRRQIYNII